MRQWTHALQQNKHTHSPQGTTMESVPDDTESPTGSSSRSSDGLLHPSDGLLSISDTRSFVPVDHMDTIEPGSERAGSILICDPSKELPPRLLSALQWRILPLLWLAFASVRFLCCSLALSIPWRTSMSRCNHSCLRHRRWQSAQTFLLPSFKWEKSST